MFVRVKKIGAYKYFYIVGNAREGGRHVQRVNTKLRKLGQTGRVGCSFRRGVQIYCDGNSATGSINAGSLLRTLPTRLETGQSAIFSEG